MANVTSQSVAQMLDKASERFAGVITKTEKAIFDSAVELIKRLDIDANGYIKNTTANLKLLSDIKSKLARFASNKEYLRGVKELAQAFDDIYKQQVAYYSSSFAQKTMGDKAKNKFAAMQRVAVANTIDGLTGAGLQTGVLDSLNKMLLKAVTSGAKYSDLVAEFRSQLISSGDSQSSLAKYAGTYATTAMTQYVGQNNKLFTDDLGTEWFEYVGSSIETTREFCNVLIEHHPYIHKSEIPDILKGEIVSQKTGEVIHVALNPKTGLPKGMIEDTTPENFQINVGGWNCRHQLVPIAKEAVPENIRKAFESKKAVQENPESGFAQFMQDYGMRLNQLRDIARIIDALPVIDAITNIKTGRYDQYVDMYHKAEQRLNTTYLAWRTAYTNQLDAIRNIYNNAVAKQYDDVSNKALTVLTKYSFDRVKTSEQYSREMDEMTKAFADLKKAFEQREQQTGTGEMGATLNSLANMRIEYVEVRDLPEGTTEEQIIERLGGRDRTKGSCSSLAFAYAGNKGGMDVLDFRDGRSREYFATSFRIGEVVKACGGKYAHELSDFTNAEVLLQSVQAGKEYYFTCGRHAAIVRKSATGYEYLELQSDATRNGWHELTKDVLRHRFGAKRSHTSYGSKFASTDYIVDIELLKSNPDFKRMLGYINTAEGKQNKGIGGGMK